MSGIRWALFFATVERYVSLALGFMTVAVTSRLLVPSEVGTAAIGMALITIATSIKEFTASGFLIQCKEVRRDDIGTAFTIQLGLTLVIATLVLAGSAEFARFYGEPMLGSFVAIVAGSLVLDAFASPIVSLLRRDLKFGILATVNTVSTCVNAIVAVAMTASGFGFMSFAWAALGGTSAATVLSIAYRPDFSVFRPSLAAWREAFAFGGYNGSITILHRVYEGLPQLVLGRLMPFDMVGLYNRATLTSGIPDKIFLSGLFNIAFPALATEARAGRDLKPALLTAYCYITVFYWPALVFLAVLANPIVHLVLGSQWDPVIPLVRIMAIANLAWFPVVLTQPVLLALGAMRHAFLSSLISLPLSALLLCACANFGIEAMAVSQLVTTPLQMYVVLTFIRRHIRFSWAELARSVRPSAAVAICSAVPLLLVARVSSCDFRCSPWLVLIILGGAMCGWALGVRITRHPVTAEICHFAEILGEKTVVGRVAKWISGAAVAKASSQPEPYV